MVARFAFEHVTDFEDSLVSMVFSPLSLIPLGSLVLLAFSLLLEIPSPLSFRTCQQYLHYVRSA